MSELIIMMRGALTYPLRQIGGRRAAHDAVSTPARGSGGRLYALDLARFLAMCFMMQGHVLDALVTRDVIVTTEFPWSIWHLIRGFTAPIFLMVSGAVHAFATKREEDGRVREDVIAKRIRWAFTIIGIGYFMMFPAGRVWDFPFVSEAGWRGFWAVNILQLTGATMLLFVVTMAGTRSVAQMGRRALWVMAGILLASPLLQAAGTMDYLPLWLSDYLTDANGSLFPMFPFSAYLFAGLAVGARLREIPVDVRDQKMKRHAWKFGVMITGFSLLAQFTLVQLGVSNALLEDSMSITLFFRRAGVVLMFFSLAVVILEKTWSMRETWAMFGTKSLWIYVIHLVLLFGTPWIAGLGRTHYRTMTLGEGAVVAAAIIALTLFAAWSFDWYARQPWASHWRTRLSWAVYAAVAWIVLV